MNYPVWELHAAGGGLLIALVAVIHVYIAHFAVGGGLLLVLTEIKARRTGSAVLLDYARRHAKFFMLLTMVGGAVTGVGIWFTIALLNPAVTSLLIHTFVFGWATEWVCFAGEIVALLVYYYGFDRLSEKDHLTVGWLYFIFAWLSLFWINGIIDFMLTPGRWPESRDFWDGFFNPTMLPALGFRTALALVLAGIFGLVTAVWMKGLPDSLRQALVAYHGRWLAAPMVLTALCGLWYWQALPADIRAMIAGRSPELGPYLNALWILALILMAGGLLCLARLGLCGRRSLAIALLVLGLVEMGAFEFLREGARRPFAVYGYIYANSIPVSQRGRIDSEGFLSQARWVSQKEIRSDNISMAGREIFRLQCSACHSVGGVLNDILPLTRKFSLQGMDAQLTGQGKLLDYMPPFMGSVEERRALARYIVRDLQGQGEEKAAATVIQAEPMTVDAFDADKDPYLLLAWSALGMFALSDCDARWSLAPPGATIYAQLIKRGETPEIITSAVDIRYQVEERFAAPSQEVFFWQYAEKLYGRPVPENTGLSGAGLEGRMLPDKVRMAFVTKDLPVVPYPRDGGFNPYPLATVEARESRSGRVLARTRVTVPVSTELGCRNCHGGPWRVDQKAGISAQTAADVLSVHDRINKTRLQGNAARQAPVRCHRCHGGGFQQEEGQPDMMDLSAAVHGFHALYMAGRGADACNACHPGDPNGATRMLRGIHQHIDLSCTNCHGSLEDHALGLLKTASMEGKKGAERLLALVGESQNQPLEDVPPRRAWTQQPDCLHCHVDFQPPDTDQTDPGQRASDVEGLYRMRSDDAGVLCAGCHGAQHALYPARNPYGPNRDVIAPRQYQQTPYPMGSNRNCRVCHTIDMEEEIHHPNTLTEFRNTIIEIE